MGEKESPVIIEKLFIENIMRIEEVVITPDKNKRVIIVSGENEQGKSSILNSIFLGLLDAKAKSSLGIKDVLRGGKDEGFIKIFLTNGLTIERRYFENGEMKLFVYDESGEQVKKSPQTIIKELINFSSIDPSSFIKMNNEDRIRTLISFTDYDLKTHGILREKLFEERTELGREKRYYEQRKKETECEEAFKKSPDLVHKRLKEITDSELKKKINEKNLERVKVLEKTIPLLVELKNGLPLSIEKYSALDELNQSIMFKMKNLLSETETSLKNAESENLSLQESIMNYKAPESGEDQESLNKQIKEIEEHNDKANKYAEYLNAIEKYNEFSGKWTEKEKQIDELNNKLIEAVNSIGLEEVSLIYDANTNFPSLYVNGVKFEQLSESKKLMFALEIACKTLGEVRIIKITETPTFDIFKLDKVVELSEKYNVQIWVERVGYGYTVMNEEGTLIAKEYENSYPVKDGRLEQRKGAEKC